MDEAVLASSLFAFVEEFFEPFAGEQAAGLFKVKLELDTVASALLVPMVFAC